MRRFCDGAIWSLMCHFETNAGTKISKSYFLAWVISWIGFGKAKHGGTAENCLKTMLRLDNIIPYVVQIVVSNFCFVT